MNKQEVYTKKLCSRRGCTNVAVATYCLDLCEEHVYQRKESLKLNRKKRNRDKRRRER